MSTSMADIHLGGPAFCTLLRTIPAENPPKFTCRCLAHLAVLVIHAAIQVLREGSQNLRGTAPLRATIYALRTYPNCTPHCEAIHRAVPAPNVALARPSRREAAARHRAA